YWMEAFRLPSLSREQLLERFTLEGHEVFDVHRAQGTGVIVAIPHSGNWDLAGAWVAAKGWPITTVAERLKPAGVYERFLDYRRGLGMRIIPHSGGERSSRSILTEALADGHVVPLVADRDLSSSGVDVEFFGEKSRMPIGPALLAIRTGAPLYTVVLRNDGPRHVYGKMEGPIEVPAEGRMADRVSAVTQAMADAFAAGIATQPEDWHMMQRLWTADVETPSDVRE
ncbi:MAG: phosphatidylinositol mannoside acyltransferase, partial [Stackebrandtia sp.]